MDRDATPELTRIVVVCDGRVKANFSDNSILLLSANGRAFVVAKNGSQQRQLSEFALSRHLAALAVVFEFRNLHLDRPCFCSRLTSLRAPREGLRLGYCMSELWWPCSPGEALAEGLVQRLDDGKVAVSTADSAGRIVLHQNRRRFAVSYPLLIRDLVQEGSFEYMWQTQVFSQQSYPARWGPALQLVLQVCQELAMEQQQQQGQDQGQGHGSGACPDALGRDDSQAAAAMRPGAAARRTEIPHALGQSASGAQDSCPTEGWWSEQTLSLLPPDELVLMEWTPQATYQFHPDTLEVEVWVHSDESCLSTVRQGRFVTHYRPQLGGPPAEQLYAAHCVPESVWGQGQGGRYALASLAAHAVKFRQQMAAVVASQTVSAAATSCVTGQAPSFPSPSSTSAQSMGTLPSQAEESFAVASEVVLEEADVPGQGHFIAYADGRLRAMFDDRTILHLNAARSHCKAVLPDGTSVLVATTQPVGVEAYVQVALAFVAWASKPRAQRIMEMQTEARVQAELSTSSRLSCLLELTASRPAKYAGYSELSDVSSDQVGRCSGHARTDDARASLPSFSPDDIVAMLRRNQELVNKL